jgi:SAM-dependent methyltransferase
MAKHPRNKLNDLDGSAWIKFTRTWFVCDSPRYHRNRHTELHPARYPEEMVAEFLRFFTKAGGWVLDPFAGSGATLVACAEEGRRGVGIELSPRYVGVIRDRLARLSAEQGIIEGDTRRLADPAFWTEHLHDLVTQGLPVDGGLPVFDFSISSPPYGDMLHTSRGGVYSKQQQRRDQGLDTAYSAHPDDLGNLRDYEECVAALAGIYRGVARVIKPGGYLVIVIQNFRAPSGEVLPLAWDLARALAGDLLFQGERIWCQNTKPLGIWGYPSIFVPNYHHHYCLIFRNHPPPAG